MARTDTDLPVITRERFEQADRLFIRSPFEMKDRVKSLPGRRWHKDSKRWHVPASQEVAMEVRRKLGSLKCDRATLELFASVADAEDARKLRASDDLPPIPHLPERANGGWTHQRQAFHFARALDGSMLAMEMGTGKSLVFVSLCEDADDDLVVIVCPNKVRKVWPREFAKWGEREWIVENGKRIARKRGGGIKKNPSSADRIEAMEEAIERGGREGKPVALVVNYEAAWQGKMRDFLLGLKIDRLAFDESHYLKAPGGKWSRFAQTLRNRAHRAVGMTGTIMPHSEPDVYAQYRALDPGIFGTNNQAYKSRYFDMGGFEDREVLGFKDRTAEEAHASAVSRIAYICGEEVLDLPPVQDLDPVTAELSADSQKAYDEMEKEFVTWVGEGNEVTAQNALVKLLRLSQITSGFLPTGGDDRVALGQEKAKLLESELADIGVEREGKEPVVVFARFKEDLARIQRIAEETFDLRYGEISGRREDGLIDTDDPSLDGTMNPECDLVAVQLKAGGVGIDLTRARHVIYYAMDFSLGDFKQSRRRCHRPGQERETFFHFLACEGTVDETIAAALQRREDVVETAIKLAKEKGTLVDDEALAAA